MCKLHNLVHQGKHHFIRTCMHKLKLFQILFSVKKKGKKIKFVPLVMFNWSSFHFLNSSSSSPPSTWNFRNEKKVVSRKGREGKRLFFKSLMTIKPVEGRRRREALRLNHFRGLMRRESFEPSHRRVKEKRGSVSRTLLVRDEKALDVRKEWWAWRWGWKLEREREDKNSSSFK